KARGYSPRFWYPRLKNMLNNRGVGDGRKKPKVIDFAAADLATITGQKPVVTRAKKSIANFKLRENVPIGCKVTLRGPRMYEFLDRLVNVALPRVRDFKGVPPRAFDGRGNYALGLREQVIFPEITYDKVDKLRAMDIVMVTPARTDEEAKALLTHLGVPFRESRDGKNLVDHEVAAPAEVQVAGVSSVPTVRPSARLSPEVPGLPDLLPGAGPEGRGS